MRKALGYLLVLLLLPLLAFVATWMALRLGSHGFSARAQPSQAEALLANFARSAATPTAVRVPRNPVAPSADTIHEGMAHYADHCAVCHANDGSGLTMLGEGMYPKPPDLRLPATQHRTDGELFSAIENGIRMSGMPAFGGAGNTDQQSWKLVLFLRHLPSLTTAELQTMEHLNPKGPDEIEEEQQENEFLHGADTQAGASKK